MRKPTTKMKSFSNLRIIHDLSSVNQLYPKMFIRPNNERFLVNFPSDLPEEFVGQILEPITDLMFSSRNYGIKETLRGTFAFFKKSKPYYTATGSKNNYQFRYDGTINLDLDKEIYHYIVSEMVGIQEYYGSVAEIGDLYVVLNDVPRAYNKHTGEYVWGKADWHGIGQEYFLGSVWISHVSNDGKTMWCHDWYYWSGYDESIFEIDIQTGNFTRHNLSYFGAGVNESAMKPDGSLLLLQGDGTSRTRSNLWRFTSENGVPTVTRITDEDTITIWEDWYYVSAYSLINFKHSPDGSLYYYYNWYGLFAFDTKTDKFLWTTTDVLWNGFHEEAIQNPITGNFYIVSYFDQEVGSNSGEAIYEFDGKTGELIRKVLTEGTNEYNYYYMCGASPDGKHIFYGSDYDDVYVHRTDTLELETKLGEGIGDWYLPLSKDVVGNHLIHKRWPSVDGFTIFNMQGQKNYPHVSWKTLDANWGQYFYLTPTKDGIVTISENGSLHMISNDPDLPFRKPGIQRITEEASIGSPLEEGWYKDDDFSKDWSPPLLFNPYWPSQNVMRTWDLGDGPRLYYLSRSSVASPEISLYRFENGKFEHYLDRVVPIPGTTLSSPNFSTNSGWLYSPTGSGNSTAYNLITGEYKTIATFSTLSSSSAGVYVDGTEYFLPSSTNVSALRYNHDTNVWNTVTRRPGSAYTDGFYQRSFIYGGNIYSYGSNGLSGSLTRNNIYRYNLPARTWTLVSTYQEAFIGSSVVIELIGDYLYMPGSGLRFHIPSSTWESMAPNLVEGKSVTGIKDRGIMYFINRSDPGFEKLEVGGEEYWSANSYSAFTYAYALPGAVTPS